jgi:hypothetical protein
MRRAFVLFSMLAGLAGCGDFPELENSASARAAEYPVLLPLDPLLAQAEGGQIMPETVANLDARIARLKARADALKTPVISAEEMDRLHDEIPTVGTSAAN